MHVPPPQGQRGIPNGDDLLFAYVELRFLIIVNFDMHCSLFIFLKKSETYPRIGVFWESAISASILIRVSVSG